MTHEIEIGDAPKRHNEKYTGLGDAKARRHAGQLKFQYGITLEDYNAMLAAQNGVCAGCGTPPTTRRLDVDHCHVTKRIRGLLCMKCNLTLGRVHDSIPTLKNLIRYLEERSR